MSSRWQAIIWTNADPIHWRIYAAQGGDELASCSTSNSVATCGNIRIVLRVKYIRVQWNLYKATTELHGLTRQVVFDNEENNMILQKFSQGSYKFVHFMKHSRFIGPNVLKVTEKLLHPYTYQMGSVSIAVAQNKTQAYELLAA